MSDETNSSLTENTREHPPITLKQFHEALEAMGFEIGYSTLSAFVKTGDIAQQMGARKSQNRLEFPVSSVQMFAEFLPEFKAAKGKLPQAPDMFRSFLKHKNSHSIQLNGPQNGVSLDLMRIPEQPVPVMAIAEAQGRAQGLAQSERVLTAKEAADLLHISVRMLRRTAKPYRRFGNSIQGDRYLLSDLLRPD